MIDEKVVKNIAEAIAAERVKHFGAAAGRAPREVEFDYARAAIIAYESAKPKEAMGWRELMKELADDLEVEIAARYPPEMREYPSIATKANLDMEPVHRARAMLSAAEER